MNLLEYRESLRIGPVDAARQLNVNFCTYYRWEKGYNVPRRVMQLKIMDWSKGQVTPNDFITKEEAKQ